MLENLAHRLPVMKCFRHILVLFVAALSVGGCSFPLSRQVDWSDRSQPIAFLSERDVQVEKGIEPYLLLTSPNGDQIGRLKGIYYLGLGEPITWAPDGNALATRAYDAKTKKSCLMLFEAEGQRCLVNDPGADLPSWSPDEQWISYSRGTADSASRPGAKSLNLVHVTSGEIKNLIKMLYYPVESISTWSPDSKYLAYEMYGISNWILMTALDGGQTITLTQGTWPAWSPKGNEIAFVRSGEIWLYHLSDKTEELLIDDPVDAGAPAWSPDGQQLLFMSKRDGNWEIYRINRDGSDLTRLTNDPAWDGFPSWRPEAR